MGRGKFEDFEALVRVAADEKSSWPLVSSAGRGISAYAKANQWVVESGKKNLGAHELGERLIELAEQTERLAPLVEGFYAGRMEAGEFASELDQVVLELEKWVAAAER